MFVQSKIETIHNHRNGLALQQRRNGQETLVQWENGAQRWVSTADLAGSVILVGESQAEELHSEYK